MNISGMRLRSTAGQRFPVNPGPVIACEYPVSPRPKLERHAVTPAQAAHRQVACEDSTSTMSISPFDPICDIDQRLMLQ
jgi:hypothetical protein